MGSARHNRKRKRKRGRLGLLFKLLCAAAFLAAATVGATVFFQVETIAVTGNSRYTAQEVIDASGVQTGDNLFRMNKFQIQQQICRALPYIETVMIRRGLPSTITFQVEEWTAAARVLVYQEPAAQADSSGENGGTGAADASGEAETAAGPAAGAPWLVSVGGKLLEEAGAGSTVCSVTGLTILAPQAGELMAVPQSQQYRLEALKDLLSALEERGQLDRVSSVDLTHSTWMLLRYEDRFDARVPLGKDLGHSLDVLAQAVEDTLQTRGEQAGGTMDLTQEGYDAVFTPEQAG